MAKLLSTLQLEQLRDIPELEMGHELRQMFNNIEPDSIHSQDTSTLNLLGDIERIFTCYKGIVYNDKEDSNPEKTKLTYLINFNTLCSSLFYNLLKLMQRYNIDDEAIQEYYILLLNELKLSDAYLFEDNPLQTGMQYARHNNILLQIYNNPLINLRPVRFMTKVEDNFIKGGRIIDEHYTAILANHLWELSLQIISFHNINSTDKPDTDKLQKQLMECWLYLLRLLDLLGHDWDSVGRLFSVQHHLKTI